MKKATNESNQKQESIIQKALRTNGFLLPETPEEVNEFENQFGTTDVILPDQLLNLDFMNESTDLNFQITSTDESPAINIAMAAREGFELPDDIKQKMKKEREDIKKKK